MNPVLVPYIKVLEAPSAEPVSLAEAKAWCRVEDTNSDDIIGLLIQAARERAEEITGRAFVRRRLELRLDAFPENGEAIALPFPPVISVEYVAYLDTGGALQTLSGSPSQWYEDFGSEPGRIQPLLGQDWPSAAELSSAVRIGYTCGYAPVGSPEDAAALRAGVPALVKSWMHARLATMYENREQLVVGNVVSMPRDFVDGLLDGLRATKMFA